MQVQFLEGELLLTQYHSNSQKASISPAIRPCPPSTTGIGAFRAAIVNSRSHPSPKHVADLVKLMRDRKIRSVLAANYFDEHKVRTVAESVGAVPVIVPLYVGGAEGADDYLKLVDLWVSSLVRAAGEAGLIAR